MSHRELGTDQGVPMMAAAETLSSTRVRREMSTNTPPVEKRRLAIRKDHPVPLNVTAVKRLFFSSRPEEVTVSASHIRKMSTKNKYNYFVHIRNA